MLLGEESVAPGWEAACAAMTELDAADWSWIIDPVDGTTNFVSGMPLSVVSIGIAQRGVPTGAVVYDPYRLAEAAGVRSLALCRGPLRPAPLRVNPIYIYIYIYRVNP